MHGICQTTQIKAVRTAILAASCIVGREKKIRADGSEIAKPSRRGYTAYGQASCFAIPKVRGLDCDAVKLELHCVSPFVYESEQSAVDRP